MSRNGDDIPRPRPGPPDATGAVQEFCDGLWCLNAPSQARSLSQAVQEYREGLDTAGQIKAILARAGQRLVDALGRSP